MSWTDERIEKLTQLWQAGLSASEIGKHLGISKNAVVGKAHRLQLPARPSPIKRETGAKRAAPAAKAQSKAAPAPKRAAAKPARPATAEAPARSQPAAAEAKRAAPDAAAPAASTGSEPAKEARSAVRSSHKPAARSSRTRVMLNVPVRAATVATSCLWPIGDPGESDFHFCGEPAVPGKPYCAEHCARAYITRSRDQRNNEAA